MTARRAALKALAAYRRNNAWPGLVLSKTDLPAREMALAKQIVNGVLQNMTLCDYYATHYSAKSLKKLEPGVLDILRISIYQIVFLEKVPNSAAVNEGVVLAKKSSPYAVGFVNAVLRKVADAAANGALPEVVGETQYQINSIKYSHPEWLAWTLSDIISQDIERLLIANNSSKTPVTAQVNTLIADTDEVLASLRAAGVRAEPHEWLDGCIEMYGAGGVDRLDAFIKGQIYIQDAAARLAVIAAGPKPGDFVIDGCAAPGGKAFAAAIAMKNTGRIAAFDIHASKLRRIEEGAARLGISIITIHEGDASIHSEKYARKADVVLADVPCSGFGVIRKRPEIRYKSERDIAGLPDVQLRILSNLSSYVNPGGTLLYSTCTVLKRENEGVIAAFLHGNDEFYPEDFSLPGAGGSTDGMLTLWPHIHGTDGFFICKLRRQA